MKRICIRFCLLIFTATATIGSAASAAAQIVVVGTHKPELDVPAVQAAVDQGGEVILQGHFSFDRPPTISTAPVGRAPAMILVTHAVAISGTQDDDGEMASIEAGSIPFYVNAPGARVTIQGLRFVRPTGHAILVYAVSGLTIASCKIEGVVPLPNATGNPAIEISTSVNPPTPANPGHPENISGTLLIANNDIDVPGTALDNTLGIIVFGAGVPGAEVEVYITGNAIRNSTERAVDLYQIGGHAYIDRNVITTSTILGTANIMGCRGTDVIHVTETGAYLVARNSIHSRWAAGGGIRADSQAAVWPIVNATVVDNDVDMQAPEDTAFDRCSAGISIFGPAQGSVVLNNRIRGRARAALALLAKPIGVPANSTLVLNRFDHFQASLADVFVEEGVMDTRIFGQGTIEDHGLDTVIVRLPFDHDGCSDYQFGERHHFAHGNLEQEDSEECGRDGHLPDNR